MKIAVAGAGYVGVSLAVLLAQDNEVVIIDVNQEKVNLLNQNKSPIRDNQVQEFLDNKELKLIATLDKKQAYENADFIIIATPTDYDSNKNSFNTKLVECIIEDVLLINPSAVMVIKSTIPLGYVKSIKEKFGVDNILFSPEFLREGRALFDNLYPSRIIIGEKSARAKKFSSLLIKGAIRKDIPVLFTASTEAEAIKLFANTYLAMRVAFFNELDTYSEIHNLDSCQIIQGVCLDPRIDDHYNNPSFGYGGYCLPKDTQQLLANYDQVPQKLISAIVSSNTTRMEFIANQVLLQNPKTIGIYRLTMKLGSDNFRASASAGVIKFFHEKNIELFIYEPEIHEDSYNNIEIIKDFYKFVSHSDVIIANRMDEALVPHKNKVYCRDLFGKD